MRRKLPPDTRPHWSDPDLPGPMGHPADVEQAHFAYLMNSQQGITADGQLCEYVEIPPDEHGNRQFLVSGPKWRNDPTYHMRRRK